MKPCTEVRHLLLEAEPHELEGEGASPVSIHVRSCPSCRLAARRVLEQTATLHAYLTPDPWPWMWRRCCAGPPHSRRRTGRRTNTRGPSRFP